MKHELTPIEKVSSCMWAKRDDTYRLGDVCGGKVRACLHLASYAQKAGARGLVTACNIHSPQAGIVACVARHLDMWIKVYVNRYTHPTPELLFALNAGATIIKSNSTYDDGAERDASRFAQGFHSGSDWALIPFGMQCRTAVGLTCEQVYSIPAGVKRIVVPVGSGITLSGVLRGLRIEALDIPVLGVAVGRDPEDTLDLYAPRNWRDMCTLVRSDHPYSYRCTEVMLGDIELDEIYEAKALPYLKPGDMFWVVGKRNKFDRRKT